MEQRREEEVSQTKSNRSSQSDQGFLWPYHNSRAAGSSANLPSVQANDSAKVYSRPPSLAAVTMNSNSENTVDVGFGKNNPRRADCFNPKCAIQHVGTAGYSVENGAVYGDQLSRLEMRLGWASVQPNAWGGIVILALVTAEITLGNYKAYLSIMDKFLSRWFPADDRRESGSGLVFWFVIAVLAALLKSGISSASLFAILIGFFSFIRVVSPVPSWIVTGLFGIAYLFATYAFFNQGNIPQRVVDRDATFEKDDEYDVELNDFTGDDDFGVEAPDTPPQALAKKEAIAPPESDSGYINLKCVVKHIGTSGYSIPTAAGYSIAAYGFMKDWGWLERQPTLSIIGLILGISSITVANFNSYGVIMDNYLSQYRVFSEGNERSDIKESDFSRWFWRVVIPIATVSKVAISAGSLYRLCSRAFADDWPRITITSVVSAGNVVATIGFFGLELKKQPRPPVEDMDSGELIPLAPSDSQYTLRSPVIGRRKENFD